jgi:hypothetical protein
VVDIVGGQRLKFNLINISAGQAKIKLSSYLVDPKYGSRRWVVSFSATEHLVFHVRLHSTMYTSIIHFSLKTGKVDEKTIDSNKTIFTTILPLSVELNLIKNCSADVNFL